jgi:hypothetical protein
MRAGQIFFFLFHRDGDGTSRGQAYLVVLDARDQAAVDMVVVTLVGAFPAVLLGQLDPVALELIYGADVDASATIASMCSLISLICCPLMETGNAQVSVPFTGHMNVPGMPVCGR